MVGAGWDMGEGGAMNPCTVVHCKHNHYDVYIGRPSIWGNPFIIGRHGSRNEVIRKYEQYLMCNPKLLAHIEELRGKVLGCWCAPNPCHGDILAKLANRGVACP